MSVVFILIAGVIIFSFLPIIPNTNFDFSNQEQTQTYSSTLAYVTDRIFSLYEDATTPMLICENGIITSNGKVVGGAC